MSDYSDKFSTRLENIETSKKTEKTLDSFEDIMPNKKVWNDCLKYANKMGATDDDRRLQIALMLYTTRYHTDISKDVQRIKNNVVFFFWVTFGIWIVLGIMSFFGLGLVGLFR